MVPDLTSGTWLFTMLGTFHIARNIASVCVYVCVHVPYTLSWRQFTTDHACSYNTTMYTCIINNTRAGY